MHFFACNLSFGLGLESYSQRITCILCVGIKCIDSKYSISHICYFFMLEFNKNLLIFIYKNALLFLRLCFFINPFCSVNFQTCKKVNKIDKFCNKNFQFLITNFINIFNFLSICLLFRLIINLSNHFALLSIKIIHPAFPKLQHIIMQRGKPINIGLISNFIQLFLRNRLYYHCGGVNSFRIIHN